MTGGDNKSIYAQNYGAANFNLGGGDAYSREMERIRYELIATYGTGRDVLDVGCANGAYLAPMLPRFRSAVGLDYVERFLGLFRARYHGDMPPNLRLICADARNLPFNAASFDFIYSYATLYTIPKVEEVVDEVARVLRPGGVTALEFGNALSLNTVVAEGWHRQEAWAKPFHISISRLKSQLARLSLRILDIRRFQLLPLYSVPRSRIWLRPLSGQPLRPLLARKLADGRILDEAVSGAPCLRHLAFRHLVIAQAAP